MERENYVRSKQSREIILYSGHEEEDAQHTEGVALTLSHEAQNALINWEAAGPMIIYASFETKKENIKLNIIQCYSPTNDKDEETKEDFYNKLQTLCDKLKGERRDNIYGRIERPNRIRQQRVQRSHGQTRTWQNE